MTGWTSNKFFKNCWDVVGEEEGKLTIIWFTPGRGLRHGCPLSSYLFILCSETLSRLVEHKEAIFQGLKVNCWAPSISHLLFVDDLFFFGNASLKNVMEVKNILKDYETWYGHAIKFSKSLVFFNPKLDRNMQQLLRDALEVQGMEVTDKYLGNHLLLPKNRLNSFSNLIEKCESNLSGWRSRVLCS